MTYFKKTNKMNKEKYYWLNDESRLFLSRGYINETPEQRIKDIANKAEEYLKIDGFATKFEDYMARGFYSLSTPVWINFGKEKGLPISCLAGDSWINTYDEGGKQIKDIEIGDLVLTHKGRYRKVTNKQVRMSDNDIFELKVQTRLTPIKITGNHPVLTNLGWVRVDELDDKKHYIATNYFIEHIEKNHKINFKTPVQNENGMYRAKSVLDIEVDEDFAWALGLWFAEGSLITNKGKPTGIRITMNVNEEDKVDRFLKIIKDKTGLNGSFTKSVLVRDGKEINWITCNISSTILAAYFESEFGNSCKTKNIKPWVKELPKKMLEEFVKGFYDGDGKKTSNHKYFTISNPKLAMSIYELSLRSGYFVGLQMQEKAGKLATTKYVYRVSYYKDDKKISLNRNYKDSNIIFDKLRFCPFSLSKKTHNEYVYDITVEEDHSFSVSGVVVHNCYGSNIDDTLDSILNAGREIGMMSKYGGGTSAYLGNIRARGSKISTGGTADGPVHYARVYDTVVDVCKQSEARRGACAVWLPIEHDDILEFLDIGTEGNPIQNLQYGVTVTDNWINDMKGGDPQKRKIWAKVIQRRNEFGFPYIMFKDNSNNNTTPYKELGMEITASNLCLTEDQRVVTSKGYLTVKELYESGEELVLFSGNEAVKSSPMLLRNEDAEILKITYSNGMTQKVTFNHGIPVLNDTMGKIQRVEAKDLKIGDYVALQTEKGLFGDLDMQDEAYLLGAANSLLSEDKPKHIVPSYIWKSNEETVKSYLYGLFNTSDNNFNGVYVGQSDFISDLQILFSNLGINCNIETLNSNTSKITIKKHNGELGVKVVAIEQVDNEPVYCPTVDNDEHIFVSNGLRTFNCSEIQLPTDSLNSFVCCLGSLNLLHWDEIKNSDAIEIYVMFLNAVMDEFILKSGKMAGMKRANRFASQHRAIGLGVLGYHSLFQSKLVPFESLMAKQLNNQIFKTIKERSDATSRYLFEEKGYKSLRDGYANTTLIAVAPTKSSSFILGQVSMGIEPIKSNYFIKDLAKSKTIYKNPFLEIELDKYGLNTPEIWESILKKDGSVQHLDFPTKEVFKSFIEISPKELILQAAQRQKYIDQSQSLNLMIHPSVPAKDINQLYLYAHEEGVKTLYYQFSQSSAQSFARNINECVSCEA